MRNIPTRGEIEEFKDQVRFVDDLRESERLKNCPDQNWYMPKKGDALDQAIDEMRRHPVYVAQQTTYPYATSTIDLARNEIDRENMGIPYWGFPHFRTTIVESGYNIECSFPRPGINVDGGEKLTYDVKRNFRTKRGVDSFIKKQTRRWNRYAKRLISAGEYDRLVGWNYGRQH